MRVKDPPITDRVNDFNSDVVIDFNYQKDKFDLRRIIILHTFETKDMIYIADFLGILLKCMEDN